VPLQRISLSVTLISTFIIIIIIILIILPVSNAYRTRVLINFSVSDYHSRASMSDGSVIYSVSEHKTASTHGAASIVASADEANLLAAYMQIRSVLSDASPLCL